jgi:hypothetical protein
MKTLTSGEFYGALFCAAMVAFIAVSGYAIMTCEYIIRTLS